MFVLNKMFHTHQSPQKNLYTYTALQIYFVPISASTYTGSYIYIYVFNCSCSCTGLCGKKRRKADAVTCTAKGAYFKLILLQDTSVKERCNMRVSWRIGWRSCYLFKIGKVYCLFGWCWKFELCVSLRAGLIHLSAIPEHCCIREMLYSVLVGPLVTRKINRNSKIWLKNVCPGTCIAVLKLKIVPVSGLVV